MVSSSSVSLPPMMKYEKPRNWAELPEELLSSILLRLGAVEILISAQKVCRWWRRVCKDPSMWRKVDMQSIRRIGDVEFDSLCRQAVDLSQGGLLEINITYFICNNDLFTYIAHRSSNLRSLVLTMCHPFQNEGLVNALATLTLLENLEISSSRFKLNWKDIGQACPQLQTLKLRFLCRCPSSMNYDNGSYVLATAERMLYLRIQYYLELYGETDTGLIAIIKNLPRLKHFDLRLCLKINPVGYFEKPCLERITELRRPDDSTVNCSYGFTFVNFGSDEDLGDIYMGESGSGDDASDICDLSFNLCNP